MKIYTIERLNKFDYDFSVSITKHGCYTDKNEAIEQAKKAYESMCAEYADEMEHYSDLDSYETEEDGALCVITDADNGYYFISFGFEEKYESHSIAVEEWELEEEQNNEYWFGEVRWCVEDIQQALMNSGYKGTIEQAETILPHLEHHGFTDHMISAGWEYIECTIGNHEDELINLED